MATWSVMVRATKNGEQRLHKSFEVKGDSEAQARGNALELAQSSQPSYRDCSFTTTTARKTRDN